MCTQKRSLGRIRGGNSKWLLVVRPEDREWAMMENQIFGQGRMRTGAVGKGGKSYV